MKKSTLKICLTQEVVLQYLHKKLSAADIYQVESHLMDCKACNEAIEHYACTHNAADNPAQPILHTNATMR